MSLPTNRRLLEEVKGSCRVFVESGSYRGDAIQEAFESGYDMVHSMDIMQENIDFCNNRFDMFNPKSGYRNAIRLHQGDSALYLGKMIHAIREPFVIFLDAHHQLLEGHEFGENPFPLMMELNQLKGLITPPQAIIIDDVLYLTHPDLYRITGFAVPTRAEIVKSVLEINPEYKIEFIANPVISNLMVCTL